MKKQPSSQDFSALFHLYSRDKSDKTTRALIRIGTICFTISVIGYALFLLFVGGKSGPGGDLPLYFRILLALYGLGFAVGFLAFIATGIHSFGKDHGDRNFTLATLHVLRNTFMFLLLPCLLIALALYLWAKATNQPGLL